MVQTGDHLQMIVSQSLANIDDPALNMFVFEVLAITAPQPLVNIALFIEAWYTTEWVIPILNMQTNSTTHTQIVINNLDNFITDFVTIPFDTPPVGTVAADFATSSNAWSFELVRTSRVTRNGSKRLPGVPDSYSINNVIQPPAIAAAANVVAQWEDVPPIDLDVAGQIQLRLVIPKTPVSPATLPTVFNPVSGVLFRGLGSQNSRKQLL